MVKKLEMTRQLQRAAALPYNHFLKNEVTNIRKRYGIPEDAEQASEWFSEYIRSGRDKGLSKDIVNPMEFILQYTPLGIEIKRLSNRFGLPGLCARLIFIYLLDSERDSLTSLPSPMVDIRRDAEGGMPTLDVNVYRIPPWTTKRDWDNIWQSKIKIRLDELRKIKAEYQDFSRKRHTIKAYDEQMKRWSEWYQLSEVQGHGPTKALEIWEDSNPDKRGKYDQSTVTKAIQEFKEIITPKD